MAPWVQSMYVVLWIPSRRTCIPPMSLYKLLWCPGSSLYFASFDLGGDSWGALVYECNAPPVTNEGIDAMYVFVTYDALSSLPLCWVVSLWF